MDGDFEFGLRACQFPGMKPTKCTVYSSYYKQYLHEIYILFDSRELVQSLFSELVSALYQIKETVDGSTLHS